MKESLKSIQRIEKKKKKMDALLEIAQLNQNDRDHRATLHVAKQTTETITAKIDPEPSPKRLRTEQGQVHYTKTRDRQQTKTNLQRKYRGSKFLLFSSRCLWILQKKTPKT